MNQDLLKTESVAREVRAVREGVGVWLREDWAFVLIEGPDAATWLQTQTTNDVAALGHGQGHANALLDRKAYLQAHFTLHRWEDDYWLIVERKQVGHLLSFLDDHLFSEEVTLTDAGGGVELVMVQGPRSPALLGSILDTKTAVASGRLPSDPYACHPIELLGHEVIAFRLSDTGEDGYLLATQAGESTALLDELVGHDGAFGVASVSPEAREVLRIEAGIPRFGVDMDRGYRLPQTTLERDAVSYTKGCYLGQEVVAKLKAYSSVKHGLMGLEFLDAGVEAPIRDADLCVDGRKIGVMKSAVYSPTLDRLIALAYLDRDYRASGQELCLTAENCPEPFLVRTTVLPFYAAQSRSERAQALYEEALIHFENDADDESDSAIRLLKEAVLLEPAFEDAYEALGVILNRHHRVDEAIYYMKALERLNPDCVMAHTNLSVFYVAKGMIEEAEVEKAKAAVLQLQHARDKRGAEAIAAEERERIRGEAFERIAMFKEVLEFDPDDPLATFGMGSAHMQLGEYEQAVPYLERATIVQKDYSVAYLNLGKCREFLGRMNEARTTYEEGISVATRKGDLMPLREMERRLKALEGDPSETQSV